MIRRPSPWVVPETDTTGPVPALPFAAHYLDPGGLDRGMPRGCQQRLDTGAIVDEGPGIMFWDLVDRLLRQRLSWIPTRRKPDDTDPNATNPGADP